jgi:outer membrane receptor for ferrienterochelin and colicin
MLAWVDTGIYTLFLNAILKGVDMRRSGRLFFSIVLAIVSVFHYHPFANAGSVDEKDKIYLDSITVTAPGSGQKIEDVQATIEIIHSDMINNFSGRSLSQVLQQATGFFVRDNGSSSSISLRGFETGHALIIVDGMRRTGKYGSTNLNGIQLEDIERIEIVRGPMSALYGSDAMSGVVNIVTRKPTGKRSFSGSIIGGMAENKDRETFILRAAGDLGTIGKTNHRISTEVKSRGDYREEEDQPYTSLKDEERFFFSYNGNYKLNAKHYLRWHAEYTEQDDEGISSSSRMGYPATYEKEKRYQLTANYHNESVPGIFDLNIGNGNADTESERTSGPEKTDYDQYEANGVWTFFPENNRHTVTIGTGTMHEKIELSILSESAKRDSYHGFFQDQWQIFRDITLVGGVRYDHYSDFGETVNPKASVSWKPGAFTARLGYGTAFQAPGFIDMYGYFERSAGRSLSIIRGNPDLEPEESRTVEVALAYQTNRWNLEGIYHLTKLENLIDAAITNITADPVSGGQTIEYQYVNVNKAEISGLELTFTADVTEDWQLTAAWEYLDKKDDDTGERLTGYARNTLKFGSSVKISRFKCHANYRWFHDFYNTDPAKPRSSPPVSTNYDVLDIKLDYQLFKHHIVSFGIDNLFDKESPGNYTRGGARLDPGERYYHIGYAITY